MKKRKDIAEILRYGIAGVTTTAVNVFLYQILVHFGLEYKVANLIALITCKVYAFFINKYFVFHSHSESISELFKECVRYIFARGFTGLIDYFGLIFAVEVLRADRVIAKYVLQIVVIILNYVLGKLLVFRKNEQAGTEE